MPNRQPFDPATLAIFNALFASVAEEMGVTLGRTAHSQNIKERRDYSCAVFDPAGQMIAQAAHIPVHLGAMPTAVEYSLPLAPFRPGDIVLLNDPYLGGTHLPDVTMVSPIFLGRRLIGYVASRAHQADIGGMAPGSMPLASELYQEGLIIPPIKLYEAGKLNRAVYDLILRNVRTPEERRGDLDAQMACHRIGEQRLQEIAQRYGAVETQRQAGALLDYAERMTRAAIATIPDGEYSYEDFLDDDGTSDESIPIRVKVTVSSDNLHVDFTGSGPERSSSINSVASVVKSAVYYVVRCLLDEHVPTNHGCFRPVSLTIPEGTVVAARPPRAVSAGNVETSQRMVDVLLGALALALPELIPAASAGSMNNTALGGYDPERERYYTYYETVGGGSGGTPSTDGLSAIQTHMTNTMNTPVEALERAYPFRVVEYAIRRGSGGAGQHRGGDGIVRSLEFLAPGLLTLISERRRITPWGLAGGQPGQPGKNTLQRADGEEVVLPAKFQMLVQEGDRLTIQTPGGGGWGASGQ
jgi:N-methylhydantoinase B